MQQVSHTILMNNLDFSRFTDAQKLELASTLIDQVTNTPQKGKKSDYQSVVKLEEMLFDEYKNHASFTFAPMVDFDTWLSNEKDYQEIKSELNNQKAVTA